MKQQIRSALLTGFLSLLPLLVTVYLVQFVFGLIDRAAGGWVSRVLVKAGLALQQDEVIWFLGVPFHGRIPVVGVAFVIILLLVIGLFAHTGISKTIFRLIERLIGFIPVVRGVYYTVQQISQAFVKETSTFKQVVLVEYPRAGVYTMGFLTGESQGEILQFTKRDYVNVFLPKSPNPTNGWMALVPRDEVTFLHMSVEDGLKFIVSGGVIPPPVEQSTEQRLRVLHKKRRNPP